MIDWDRVTELREEFGDGDFQDIVTLFLDEVEAELGSLRGTTPREGLEGRLHSLKGSALNLGFTEFAARCQAGESLAASGAAHDVDLAAICTAYDRCKSQFLSGHPGS
ncbi:Hpt domain-containing protein [Roseovarius nubinhibens]|uniref:Hpt domain-containing protein n=1 Tax=Roseovarius nubinhibens TaxID=314263 RepID=UPI001C097927|nr:Hpt domain-containing protein [Roseovarius nubinhibens]MBU2999270.1 Hpt domain-containing protein [Roseovarius nubinhibens]